MERLIVVLQALAMGLGKVRRAAVEVVVEGLREEQEEREYLQEAYNLVCQRADEVADEVDAAFKLRDEAERKRAEAELALVNAHETVRTLTSDKGHLLDENNRIGKLLGRMGSSRDVFNVQVWRSAITAESRIGVVKAHRTACDIGLLEAKEAVDAAMGGEGMFEVVAEADMLGLGQAVAALVFDGRLEMGKDFVVRRIRQ